MKLEFPHYATSFECNCTVEEAENRISKVIADQQNNLQILEISYTDVIRIGLSVSTGGYVYYNSFKPFVSIEIGKLKDKTLISIVFELKKSTKNYLMLFFFLALLFEASLLIFRITNQLTISILVFLPFGMLFSSYLLSSVGLFLASKDVLKILFGALTHDDRIQFPNIQKFNV